MYRINRFWSNLPSIILVAVVLGGCNMPADAPAVIPAETLPPATRPPYIATDNLPTSTMAVPTAAPQQPTLTQAAVNTATSAIILQKKLYSGVMVFNVKTTEVQAYGFDGKPLGFKSTLPGSDWLNVTQVQAFPDTVYYFSYKDRQVMRRDLNGLQPLSYIAKSNSIHFLISEDQKRIAWTVDDWSSEAPGSELWVANIDGSNASRLMVKDPKNNPNFLIFQPLRWLQNGQLIFVEEPTGIGGYILFYGFAEIWVVDPVTKKFANFSPPTGKGGLCLVQISPDTVTTISTCGGSTPSQLVMYHHLTKTSTPLAVVPGQEQAGSVFYSPNGQWIAYGAARGNPEKETGWLVVVPAGGAPIKIIHEVNSGYLNVVGWVDDERILFIRYTANGHTIFIVNKDGSNPVKVADGDFAGMIPVQ